MKTIRKVWPRVRSFVKSGNTYFSVDMRRKHYAGPKFKGFNNKDDAVKYASDFAEKVAKTGLDNLGTVQDGQRLKAWAEQCAVYGKTLEQAMEVALASFAREQEVKDSHYMAELLNVWLDDKITGLKKLRPASIDGIREMSNRFKADFGTARIKEIDVERIENYLKAQNISDQSRLNLCRYLQQFFNWCIRKGYYHATNPAEQVKREIHVVKSPPAFFTVDQCQALLTTASQSDHRALLAKAGVTTAVLRDATETVKFNGAVPDVVAYLQGETELTRSTIVRIITESKRLPEFLLNPQKYMDAVSAILKQQLHKLIIDGIKYEKVGNAEYEMRLFEDEEIMSYLNNRLEVKHSVYDAVVYDSEIEREFAEKLDKREDIKLFVKLPDWFKIETPLGTYNPDWAILKDDDKVLYLVRETKGTKDFEKLRNIEAEKIRCGRKHFESLDVDFAVVTSANEI